MSISEDSGVSLVLKAAAFAAEKHRTQRRKDVDASPYINHPLTVSHILSSDGGVADCTILAAAILHDTIEDTKTTEAELVEHFGPSVANIVAEVTDDKSLPKEERKRLQVTKAPVKSDGAKLVKLADKISNLRDIAEFPPADWSADRKERYLRWAKEVVDGLRGVNAQLERAFDEDYERGLRSISALISRDAEEEEVELFDHPIPEQLRTAVVEDLVSRIAEMGRDRPESADEALTLLKALPEIGENAELEIVWYSGGGPPSGATLNLTARELSLSVSDEDGSREIYRCEARFYPDVDSDLEAWLSYFRALNAPEVAISVWGVLDRSEA